jgi:hypothetical protein
VPYFLTVFKNNFKKDMPCHSHCYLLSHTRTIGAEFMQAGVRRMFRELKPASVCAALDTANVSRRGWSELYKLLKMATTAAGFKMPVQDTANPNRVLDVKKAYDQQCRDTLLKDIPKEQEDVVLDLDTVIKWAVDAAVDADVLKVSRLKADGKVMVVITLDETHWPGGKKMERVCIKVVNQMVKTPTEVPIQSEHDVYILAMFYVVKESYEILKEKLAPIDKLVRLYEQGRLINLGHGLPPMRVEFHLACDLKTLFACYKISNGANAKIQGLFDAVELKDRPEVIKAVLAGTYQKVMQEMETAQALDDAVFGIPVSRVHFCSLHCRMRLVEYFVNKLVSDVWSQVGLSGTDLASRQEKLRDLEDELQRVGLYGGNVEIREDKKRSTKNGPAQFKKLSMNGDLCKKLLKRDGGMGFKALIGIVTPGSARREALLRVWGNLVKVCHYLEVISLTDEEKTAWPALIQAFLTDYISLYGQRISKYMYILATVGQIYMDTHGAFAVWNAQAMEKSHSRAKCHLLTKTNRGGGVTKLAVSQQLIQISFRVSLHRRNKIRELKETPSLLAQFVAVEGAANQVEGVDEEELEDVEEEEYMTMIEARDTSSGSDSDLDGYGDDDEDDESGADAGGDGAGSSGIRG